MVPGLLYLIKTNLGKFLISGMQVYEKCKMNEV